MARQKGLDRRRFVKLYPSTAAAAGLPPCLQAAPQGPLRRYARVRLVDGRGAVLRAADLHVGVNYIFHYPYVTTPCFLLNLGEPARPDTLTTDTGHSYRWPGGVGPHDAIVAFSAICSHRMSYPARQVSFINYRPGPTAFVNKEQHSARKAHIIYCCSENSVYDATDGARVLGGPAPDPLATIRLEYDRADDALYATGTQGAVLFERFFDKFGFHLALEYETSDIRQQVADASPVVPLADYTRNRILC
ncbi:MAG: hypothetical protein P8180_07550 [Gammaproteobacteria bacterium]